MLRRRLDRLTTALFVVLSLLFSQLALANYACPGQADVEAMAAMMATGQPCDGMDPQQPALCHEHAADPGKTVEGLKLPKLSLPRTDQLFRRCFLLPMNTSLSDEEVDYIAASIRRFYGRAT